MLYVKSGYAWLLQQHRSLDGYTAWKWVWRIPSLEKCRFLVWLICHNALPTNDLRMVRGLAGSSMCQHCHSSAETVLRCLRDCFSVWRIWHTLEFVSDMGFFTDNLRQWLLKYANHEKTILFYATIWWLWVRRNNVVINRKLWTDSETLQLIFYTADNCKVVFTAEVQTNNSSLMVGWSPPSLEVIKIKVDYSVSGASSRAGFGGLLRDSNGEWIVGFSGSVGNAPILLVELKVIHQGFILAWHKDFRNIICESDCLEVVRLVNSGTKAFHVYSLVTADIRQVMGWSWESKLVHVYREGNTCADFLAKKGAEGSFLLDVYQDYPKGILSLIMP